MSDNRILVVDVEATCYPYRRFPPGEVQEIIEIGVCVLDLETGERSGKRSFIVKPVQSTVSAFCTELTTLTQDMVDSGLTLVRACELLREHYDSPNLPWMSWGAFDEAIFRTECRRKGIDYPFSDDWRDAKDYYGEIFGVQKRRGMKRTLERLKIPLEGTHHRGADDAWNIAAIIWRTAQKEKEILEG